MRIARILAGEGTEQFSGESKSGGQQTVPLSVALEYVGAILDESRKEISRLKVRLCLLCKPCILRRSHRYAYQARLASLLVQSEVQEYNSLCNSMEAEVSSLLRASQHVSPPEGKLRSRSHFLSCGSWKFECSLFGCFLLLRLSGEVLANEH